MDNSLERDIKEIEDELSGQRKNNFIKCVQKLKYPNSRPWPISDDSLSGVQKADQDCKNCIENSGSSRKKIESCIKRLLTEYPRH
ncbi:MAG: hypothetical protein RMY64_04865 [Nostoc sp. DedQUE08]|uniref:hypothetical protein n=1 Tax=unclassified Nostoc TaxID=2593658 RepID=UPI002AD53F6B|nr:MULTISPECIES: hypothetical protein [unclassified Nostoc]MDZ8030066.1 hypothetical protein [Nostoc sp. DedSLP04]MDZ8064960.1 hypothetical protein [Nostoc sp. DedQUE08]